MYLLKDININLQNNSPVIHEHNTTMYNHGLVCGITEYTRIEIADNGLSKSCMDHIYARSLSLSLNTAAPRTALADYRIITLAEVNTVPSTRMNFEDITSVNYNLLTNNLKQVEDNLLEI